MRIDTKELVKKINEWKKVISTLIPLVLELATLLAIIKVFIIDNFIK